MLLVPPEGWPRRVVRGFKGRRALGLCWVFLSERFLFCLPGEAFFAPTGKLLSASGAKSAAPAL
jgi:hypothetical protein